MLMGADKYIEAGLCTYKTLIYKHTILLFNLSGFLMNEQPLVTMVTMLIVPL